jgi:hypothetical protein
VNQIGTERATAAGACFLERLGIDPSRPDDTRRLLELLRQLGQARKTESVRVKTGGVR